LEIRLPVRSLNEGVLLDLKETLREYPGTTPVLLRISFANGRDKVINLGARCRVAADGLLEALRRQVRDGAVVVVEGP